jgi:hypothetical protein
MAGPMLIVATGLSALMFRYILGYDGEFTFTACLLYGAIISATDPVAVVSLLKELGASKKISTMIEGESLLNIAGSDFKSGQTRFKTIMSDYLIGAGIKIESVLYGFLSIFDQKPP